MDTGEPIPGTAPREVGQKIEPMSHKISRREFLKLTGATLAGLALKPVIDATANVWQPKVVDLGIDVLKNPAVVESVLGTSASFLETLALQDHRAIGAPKITMNPSYKPIAEIIQEVLDRRRSEGKTVFYQRVAGYEGLPHYLDKIRRAAHDPVNRDRTMIESGELPASSYILGYKPGIFELLIYNEDFFPKETEAIYDMSNLTLNDSADLVRNGSGFLEQTVRALGEESRILPQRTAYGNSEEYEQALGYWQAHGGEIGQVVRTYLQDTIQHIETLVIQAGAPISVGEILSYYLDRNSGSINKSLMDTTLFLKYMARSDITLYTFDEVKLDPEKTRANEDWFKSNIKDEYGKVGCYSELPHETYPYNGLLSNHPGLADPEVDKDLHLLNQIGKPYHTWNIVTMLVAVPPTLAQIGVAQRQLKTFDEQGPIKSAADFRVALELSKLDLLFSQV